jgi:hypothetical protein
VGTAREATDEVLGHATLATLTIYTQITDRRKRDAYVRLQDYLREVAAVSEIIDIRKRLEDRQITRDGLLAEQQSPTLDPKYSRALYSLTLAFACYVGLESEEFIGLLERARTAGSINDGATDALTELRENLGEIP